MLKWGFAFFLGLLQVALVAQNCDTAAAKALSKRSGVILKTNVDSAYKLARGAMAKSSNCPGSLAYHEAVLALASAYYQKDLSDSLVRLLLPVLQNLPENTPGRIVGGLHHKLSKGYVNTMELEKGLRHALLALSSYESYNDTANTANALATIANIYQQQNNFNQAYKYLKEAEKKAGLLPAKTALGNVYNTMGILYAEHGQLDSAEKFFLLSTHIREQLNDQTTLVWNYNNLGGLYIMMHRLKAAGTYLEKALDIFTKEGNTEGQMDVANNLGELYMQLYQDDKALYYYSYSRRLHALTNNPDNLENLYANLSKYYKLKGDPKTALLYADSLVGIKDSLFGHRLDASMAEMQTKYETEKKDLELAKNKAELEIKDEQVFIKNVIIAAVVCLLLLLGISAWLFYRKKQVQQKAELDAELTVQKELRNRSVIEAEEKERIRIATDLHDGVGQLLSAAKLNLSSLESKINLETPGQQTAFNNALALVDDSVKEVRSVSHNMMPNTLLKLGLGSAVKEFVTKIQGTPNLKVNLEIVGLNTRMEQEKETVLYRVIQEIVSNIIKHAKATELTLQLIRHETELSILVEDNGVGFDTSRINDFEGIGLKNILSRVEFINGSVHFDSELNRGTTVVIDVPLNNS